MSHSSRPTRRTILKSALVKAGGLSLLSLGPGPSFLTRAALASSDGSSSRRPKVLVTIFQRGAMDGLMAVAPLADPHLSRLRPGLTMGASRTRGRSSTAEAARLIDLGNGYGLHPAFAELLPWWQEAQLGIVHGVGSPDPTRSHFDAQDFMESGTPGRKGTADGWLNRVAGELGHDATPFRAVSLTAAKPKTLAGPEPALAVADLKQLRLAPEGTPVVSAGRGFEALYRDASADLLRSTARETFEAMQTLEALDLSRYRTDADYPQSPLGRSLAQIAFLIKSQVGLELAFAESGGWDTHVRQGREEGSFSRRARDLGNSIAAFWKDLGPYRDEVMVMTMTEFGRTVAENGSGGTDHGHGSCLFLLGGDVRGGQVHGSLPTLAPDNLFEGRDLPVSTDFRAVFTEVAGTHLSLNPEAELFPGWRGSGISLLRRG